MVSVTRNLSPEGAASGMEIRSVRPDDLDAVIEICQSDHVNRGTMRLPVEPRAWVEKRIKEVPGTYKMVALRDGAVAGYGELVTYPDFPRHWHVAEVEMIATHPDHRGAGVGQELLDRMIDMADRWLQIRRLQLFVWTSNTSAVRLYESRGFRIEGTMKDFVFLDGAYTDAHVMARLRPAPSSQVEG